jgi:hypothetical protein
MDSLLKISLAPATIIYSYIPENLVSFLQVPCLFKTMTGCECYGCGTTRGIKSLLHLNLDESLKYNSFSFIVLILIMTISIITLNKYLKIVKKL